MTANLIFDNLILIVLYPIQLIVIKAGFSSISSKKPFEFDTVVAFSVETFTFSIGKLVSVA